MEFKDDHDITEFFLVSVQVETEWNLKRNSYSARFRGSRVQVETEWNLKTIRQHKDKAKEGSIGRNRMEFKDIKMGMEQWKRGTVQVETEWNLKPHTPYGMG